MTAQQTHAELRAENEDLRLQLRLMATEYVYHGNSVQHWYSKATAYSANVGRVCDILRRAGYIFDGNTENITLLKQLIADRDEARAKAGLAKLNARVDKEESQQPDSAPRYKAWVFLRSFPSRVIPYEVMCVGDRSIAERYPERCSDILEVNLTVKEL
jgi:hypothetical protein